MSIRPPPMGIPRNLHPEIHFGPYSYGKFIASYFQWPYSFLLWSDWQWNIHFLLFGNRTVAKRGKSKHLTKQLLDYERFIQKASWIRPQHSGLASLPSYVKHEPSVLGAPGNTLFSKSLQENNALKQHVHHQKKKKKRERVKAKYIFREIHILKF